MMHRLKCLGESEAVILPENDELRSPDFLILGSKSENLTVDFVLHFETKTPVTPVFEHGFLRFMLYSQLHFLSNWKIHVKLG